MGAVDTIFDAVYDGACQILIRAMKNLHMISKIDSIITRSQVVCFQIIATIYDVL